MDKYETEARLMHKNGKTCSYSLYNAFQNDFNLEGTYPLPRSIDGKCGAILTTEKILDELNLSDKKEEFVQRFLKEFGETKCIELMKKDRRCNDYVGFAAQQINEYINK